MSHWQPEKNLRSKRVSEVSNSGAYPQQPRFIGIYTMKKFKIKEPTIMRTERRGDGRKHSPEIGQFFPATTLERQGSKG